VNRRVRRLGIGIVGLFALLFGQIAYVQVFAAERIANDPANATRQLIAEYDVERGPILASDGTVLAKSVDTGGEDALRYQREYPEGDLYGQITGYYSSVYGRSGLEQSMNAYLGGSAPELATSNLTDLVLGKPKKGGTVVTTLVPALQRAAREALGSNRGAIAALDPQTGDVLALWSNPSYDPTGLATGDADAQKQVWDRLNADPEKPLLSKAFQELYLPGSTFKLVTASAALENGVTTDKPWPNPLVLDLPLTHGTLENFGGESCNGGTKTVTIVEAFTSSCNVPFAEIGLDLGADKLSEQAQAYGFCPTLPPEETGCSDPMIPFAIPFQNGRFPEPAYFEQNDPLLALSAIGLDNDLTNPLHLALISSAIANGGNLFAPRLVGEIRDPSGRVVKRFDDQDSVSHPITSVTAETMRQMMVNVVEQGTGTAGQIAGVTVAGKTGTATNGENEPPNAWFTAFAPAGQGETPSIAVAVIVLDGGSLGDEATGGRVAAPIAAEVIQAWLNLKGAA
jgi:peptidoglycan glycosyltransferase